MEHYLQPVSSGGAEGGQHFSTRLVGGPNIRTQIYIYIYLYNIIVIIVVMKHPMSMTDSER